MKKYEYKKDGYLILGINGWTERRHDASAALIQVTKDSCHILGALEEEKIVGIKRADNMFPTKSVQCLLEIYGLVPEDIDEIAIGWNFPKLYKLSKYSFPFMTEEIILNAIFDRPIEKKIKIHYIDHHLAHASCSYRTSGMERALTIVIDGQGEDSSISIWKSQNSELMALQKIPISGSLGYLYEALNYILGFKTYESGKSMGLAAYGEATYFNEIRSCFCDFDVIRKIKLYIKVFDQYAIKTIDKAPAMISAWRYYFENDLKILHLENKITSFYEVTPVYRNLASSVQKVLEDIVTDLILIYVKETNISDICLGGGVALNCKMNGEIINNEYVKNIFINPAANDAGVSLGAALELAYQLGYDTKLDREFNPFLGAEMTNDEVIDTLVQKGIKYKIVDDASDFIASSIESNRVIALFQGRNEWGPRALGNRSIIANPTRFENLDFINKYVKKRELGRPLSPSICDEDSCYLTDKVKIRGRYMNVANYAEYKELCPAVVHVDNTYRPGFVNESFNPIYYRQLNAVKRRLGNSIVINTSFNVDTPIIFWVDDAIRMLKNRDLNAVVFNNNIIVNKE